MYSFEEKIALHGYHVFRNTTWTNVKAAEKVTVMIETDKSSFDVGVHPLSAYAKFSEKLIFLTL